MDRLNTSCRVVGVMVAISGLSAGLAQAQGVGNDYCVRHTFRLTTPGNIAPAVFLNHAERTFAKTNTCKDEDKDSGTVPIGVGLTTKTVSSIAPGSTADATAEADVTALGVGLVAGSIEARGNATATIAGCPPPQPPRGYGRATAYSGAQITARGRYLDSRGRIRYSGGWRNSLPVAGSKARSVVKDPIRGRLIDNTTGITTELVMLSLHSSVSGGATAWDAGVLSNTASNMVFDLTIGSTFAVQSGTLRVAAKGGIVIESVASGVFAGMPIPAVGAPAGFAVALPEIVIDYDMGADPAHDVAAEIDFDGAGETEEDAAGVGPQGSSMLITNVASGYDRVNVSELTLPNTAYGFHTNVMTQHVADDFDIPMGPPALLDALAVPIYQTGAPEGFPIVGAYVRLWLGEPGLSGTPIAGDMTTNRLMDYRYDSLNRVIRQDPLNHDRMVHEAWIDMSWAPPLPPGRYWVEIATRGQNLFTGPWTPPAVWSTEQDNAKAFDVATQTWAQLVDPGTGQQADLAVRVYGPSGQVPVPCYANCDGSQGTPQITPNDYACFLNKYANGDPYANCDGSVGQPLLTPNDFLCFLNRAAQGCN